MSRAGMTLLEVTVSIAILSTVMGVLFMLAASLGQVSATLDSKMSTQDEARRAMMAIVRDLRQSANMSIDWTALPGPAVTYQTASDIDGNGIAVDNGGNLELSAPRTITRDLDDLNGDGMTTDQLVLVLPGGVRVLANDLAPEEDADMDGVLDSGEDQDGNGRLDHGIWFEPDGSGIRVSLRTRRSSSVSSSAVASELSEIVVPRN